jgi:hypothetical protein
MKYAFLLFTFITFLTFTTSAFARTVASFKDSPAIQTVAQFMYDSAEDMPLSTRMSDRKLSIKDFTKCSDVGGDDVFTDVEESIKRVLRFYPDEDIPFEQALLDLEDYIDHQYFKKCTFEKKTSQSKIISTYYVDLNDKIHLRLDNIALSAE